MKKLKAFYIIISFAYYWILLINKLHKEKIMKIYKIKEKKKWYQGRTKIKKDKWDILDIENYKDIWKSSDNEWYNEINSKSFTNEDSNKMNNS